MIFPVVLIISSILQNKQRFLTKQNYKNCVQLLKLIFTIKVHNRWFITKGNSLIFHSLSLFFILPQNKSVKQ